MNARRAMRERIGAARRASSRARRGMTLMEILVAISIMLLITVMLMPSLEAVFLLEQRGAARRLALAYAQLHDEAILRNRTFRVAFHLDEHYYEIESGDGNTVIFTDFESREEGEERLKEIQEEMDPEEWAEYTKRIAFEKVEGHNLGGQFRLPGNTVFKSVYTPQYEEPVTPRSELEREAARKGDEKKPNVVYSYMFSNGFAEYTVVQMVDKEDDKDGFTITVDPLSGKVDLRAELIDGRDAFRDLPRQGPRLSN